MHASATASMFILQPMTISGLPLLIYLLAFAAVWWALVAAVTWISRSESGQIALTARAA
jgi:hypothetical protein